MKFKAGDRVYVTHSDSVYCTPGIYTVNRVYDDNMGPDSRYYPYDIKGVGILLSEDQVREVTPLDELL